MRVDDSKVRLAIVALLVAAGLGASSWGWSQLAEWQQRRHATQLSKWVADAGSERVAVAAAAQYLIDETVENWRLRAAETDFDFATHASALATALAERIHDFEPDGKRWAAGLALSMVKLTEDAPAPEYAELLQNCSRILAAAPRQRARMQTVATDESRAAPQASIIVPSLPTPDSPEPIAPGVPNEIPKSSVLPPSAPLASQRVAPPTATPAPQAKPNWTPQWQVENRAQPLPRPTTPSSVVITDSRRLAVNGDVIDVPTPTEMTQLATSLRDEPTDELLKQIPKANFYRAGIIRNVLRQRGLADTELELAHRLSSDRVGDRLQLIDDLSALPASTARRWLRLLLSDESADVRLRALTAMATTSDPQLYDLAREMALNDGDPRIAELASRIMRQVR